MLVSQVARSREAELEACGRANGLQQTVDILRQTNDTLSRQNEMLMARAFGVPPGPSYPASAGLPTIIGGQPLGSPRPPQIQFPDIGDVGLPVPTQNPRRGGAPVPPGYEMGAPGNDISFDDMGDDAAAKAGIQDDETTGALVGGPARPRTQ